MMEIKEVKKAKGIVDTNKLGFGNVPACDD